MQQVNKIINGDVLEVLKKIPSNSVHLAITSPPYNVGKEYDTHNDKMNYDEYLDWLNHVWKETKRVLVSGGRFCLNIAPTGIKEFVPIHHDFSNQMRNLSMLFRTEIIWYKQTMLKRTAWGSFKSPSNPHIIPSWEYILVYSKDQNKLTGNREDADITKEEFMKFSDGMWYIPPETQRNGHPAPFPEELIYRLIKFYSFKGNTILDMFGGTGTVALVSAKTDRNFIHIDISEEYCKTAERRIKKYLSQSKIAHFELKGDEKNNSSPKTSSPKKFVITNEELVNSFIEKEKTGKDDVDTISALKIIPTSSGLSGLPSHSLGK